MNKQKTQRMALLAIFITIELVLAFTPFLGFIPLGFINATTLHIPVIIAALMLGPKEGAIVGFVFGLTSVIKATLEPNLSSFIFSPFITVGETTGNLWSLVIAIVPRICIGLATGYSYLFLKKRFKSDILPIGISAALGSLTNTLLVLSGIYIFFGREYAALIGKEYELLLSFLAGIIATAGLAEAGVAVVFAIAIMKASQAARRK